MMRIKNKQRLIIATRESPLALCQAEEVKALLEKYHSDLSVEFLKITTEADKRLSINLLEIGGKGWFVKELEEAILDGRADIAVHSMKDVPMDLPAGLEIAAILAREEPWDVFVSNRHTSFMSMPKGACLGTSSLRRQAQLRALRPDLHLKNLRGNIGTRLRRLDDGDFAAIILAAAGLKRLGALTRIREHLTLDDCLPAAGQGAIGVECLSTASSIKTLLIPLNHALSFSCVSAERAACQKLGGGCQVPVAAFAEYHAPYLYLKGLVASQDGSKLLRAYAKGSLQEPEVIGHRVADALLAQGAAQILQEFRK